MTVPTAYLYRTKNGHPVTQDVHLYAYAEARAGVLVDIELLGVQSRVGLDQNRTPAHLFHLLQPLRGR